MHHAFSEGRSGVRQWNWLDPFQVCELLAPAIVPFTGGREFQIPGLELGPFHIYGRHPRWTGYITWKSSGTFLRGQAGTGGQRQGWKAILIFWNDVSFAQTEIFGR
jgi:hypothetical protein